MEFVRDFIPKSGLMGRKMNTKPNVILTYPAEILSNYFIFFILIL